MTTSYWHRGSQALISIWENVIQSRTPISPARCLARSSIAALISMHSTEKWRNPDFSSFSARSDSTSQLPAPIDTNWRGTAPSHAHTCEQYLVKTSVGLDKPTCSNFGRTYLFDQ